MKQIIAFDVDGIFTQGEELSEYVLGYLDAEKINQMHNDGIDSKCVIVSPSPYYPKRDGKSLWELFTSHETKDMRHQNLIDSVNAVSGDIDMKIYVSDNDDYDEAKKAGFIYVDVLDFYKAIEENVNLKECFGR
ncbi:MAG: hypothetical protein COA77_07220 [Thaumarchaeota archaeon]|nr:MAG: hypothetical protein COA77_07220 [Nitrososphaerota archaeon]